MKTKITRLSIPITLVILLLLSAAPGYAQGQGVITASVDRTALAAGETLVLTVALNTDATNLPEPSLPALGGFNLVGSGRSTQVSIINGAISAQLIYNYYLEPYATGDLVIEPIQATINGQTYATEPITVRVTQGAAVASAAPPADTATPASEEFAGQELFVEAEVDNPAPYVGQPVAYTIRFYHVFGLLDQPRYQPPAFTGFWADKHTDESHYQVQAAGLFYDVTELRTVLFPTMAGSITIEPARLSVPGGFFSRGAELQTQPVSLEVRPLPANAPASFSGAVGQFGLEGTVDRTEGKVNEPITWRVTLSGWGNLEALPDLAWPDMPGWRSFESQATTNTQLKDGQVFGSRVYERLLVPQAEGEFTIPALEYAYFDPVAEEYKFIATQPTPVSIAPGDPVAAQQPESSLPGVSKETVQQVAMDIRHLKPVPATLSFAKQPITESGLYWLAWGIPLLGLVGSFAWQKRQLYLQNNAGLARSSQARKKAKRALDRARKEKGDVYSAAGSVLTAYLVDKLDRPVAGLTRQVLADQLAEKGLTPELVERVGQCLTDAELGRFSPDSNDPAHAEHLLQEIDTLISDLERYL